MFFLHSTHRSGYILKMNISYFLSIQGIILRCQIAREINKTHCLLTTLEAWIWKYLSVNHLHPSLSAAWETLQTADIQFSVEGWDERCGVVSLDWNKNVLLVASLKEGVLVIQHVIAHAQLFANTELLHEITLSFRSTRFSSIE